jgi:hypothetical protein
MAIITPDDDQWITLRELQLNGYDRTACVLAPDVQDELERAGVDAETLRDAERSYDWTDPDVYLEVVANTDHFFIAHTHLSEEVTSSGG